MFGIAGEKAIPKKTNAPFRKLAKLLKLWWQGWPFGWPKTTAAILGTGIEGMPRHWVLQDRERVVKSTQHCQQCGGEIPPGHRANYRVEATSEGDFWYGYQCFICVR